MAPTTRSIAKRRRIESAQPQNAVPPDALLLAFGFLAREDVASLCRVSSSMNDLVLHSDGSAGLWRTLAVRSCGPVIREIWESLRGTSRAHATRGGADVVARGGDGDAEQPEPPPPPPPMSDSELWRRIMRSREAMLRKPGFDDPNGALDSYYEFYATARFQEPELIPVSPGTEDYDFTVHLWDESGEKVSQICEMHLVGTNAFQENILYLNKSTTVAKLIRSRRFQALEIEVSSKEHEASSVIYSCPNPLVDSYGGAAFEEYSSMACFECYDHDDGSEKSLEEQRKEGWVPEKTGWLPFVRAPELELGTRCARRADCIRLKFQTEWRCRNQTGRVGEEYVFAQEMNRYETRVFLENRCYGTEYESGKQPRCDSLPSEGPMSPTPDYSPRDLSNYSFLVDFKDKKDSSNNRTIFYETAAADEWEMIFGAKLGFELPPSDYDAILPCPEDYTNESSYFQIDKIFTVYVIDRQSGRQAKLLETDGSSDLWARQFVLERFFSFERFKALTKYWTSSNANGIPVPMTEGRLQPVWKRDADDADRKVVPPKIVVWLGFLCWNKNPEEGNSPIDTVHASRKDTLTFLEKGLIYE